MDKKILYVLISNENDDYYEQLLISAFSAKFRMPDVKITLLTDNRTRSNMVGYRAKVLHYIDVVKVVDFPDEINNKERSRFLKTTMRNEVEGDFLYIDCDTVICDGFDFSEFEDIEFGAVVDCHAYSNIYKAQEKYRQEGAKFGFKDLNKAYFNGGVLWVKDTKRIHDFFRRWKELYSEMCLNGITLDQISLNQVNQEMGNIIQELDGKWNCLAMCGVRYLSSANIIHYVGSGYVENPAFLLCNKNLFIDMKDNKEITHKIMEIIINPKQAFKETFILPLADAEFQIIKTPAYQLLLSIYKRLPRVFKSVNRVSRIILNVKRK